MTQVAQHAAGVAAPWPRWIFLGWIFLGWIFLGWMYAAFPIGWTISHLLLFVVYFLIFTPVGLVLRWTGRDLLERNADTNASSYWKKRSVPGSMSRYFRQF